jgi:hypothetical protein
MQDYAANGEVAISLRKQILAHSSVICSADVARLLRLAYASSGGTTGVNGFPACTG